MIFYAILLFYVHHSQKYISDDKIIIFVSKEHMTLQIVLFQIDNFEESNDYLTKKKNESCSVSKDLTVKIDKK